MRLWFFSHKMAKGRRRRYRKLELEDISNFYRICFKKSLKNQCLKVWIGIVLSLDCSVCLEWPFDEEEIFYSDVCDGPSENLILLNVTCHKLVVRCLSTFRNEGIL